MNKTEPGDDSRKRAEARDKLEELREHPELAGHPGYCLKHLRQYGEPYAWFLLLMKQPQLAPPEEWWNDLYRLSYLPWARLLAAQPQFEKYCPWESVGRRDLVELALLAPEIFARQFPQGNWRDLCAFLTTPEWRQLLIDVPDADRHLDMAAAREKLSDNDWMCVLAYRPQLEKYFDWSQVEKRPSVYWAYLLRRQPQFADRCDWALLEDWQICQILVRQPQFASRCDWSRLKGWQIREILERQPQLKTPELERLIEEDEIWGEYQEDKYR